MEKTLILRNYLKLFGITDASQFFSKDECNYIVTVLTHEEEKADSRRDVWGNWDYIFTKNNYQTPHLDEMVIDRLKSKGVTQTSLWPENAPFAFCLTHDLDVVTENDPAQLNRRYAKYLVSASLKERMVALPYFFYTWFRKKFTVIVKDPLWHFEWWRDAERKYGFTSTYYVFAGMRKLHHYDCDYLLSDEIVYDGKKCSVKEYIKQLCKEGCEIGLHGSYNSYNDEALFMAELDYLKSAVEQEIHTTRQHFLHYHMQRTPLIHKMAGIKTDSTLGFNCATGFRAGTAMPYFLDDGLLEVPMIIMDGALFNENSHHFDERKAKARVLEVIEMVEHTKGCLVINFHPNYLNRPLWWNTYLYLLEELHKRHAWCGSMENIYNLISKKCAE